MAFTRPKLSLTDADWTVVVAGPVRSGTIQADARPLTFNIQTVASGGQPAATDTDGITLRDNDVYNFALDGGETLYARAVNDFAMLNRTY